MISKLISVFLNRFIFKKKKKIKRKNTHQEQTKKKSAEKHIETFNRPLNWISEKYRIKSKNLKIAIFFIAIISLFFGSYVKTFLFITIFVIVATASKLIQEFFPFVVGFDLVLFVTVLSTMHYGWVVGALVGCTSSFVGSMYRIRQQMDTAILPLIGYVIVALIIPHIMFLDLFGLGVVSAIIYAVIMSLLFLHLRADIFNTATFAITTIAFNWWLFSNVAPFVVALM